MTIDFYAHQNTVCINLNELTAGLEPPAVDALTIMLETSGAPGGRIPTVEDTAWLDVVCDKINATITLTDSRTGSETETTKLGRDKFLRSLRVVARQAFGIISLVRPKDSET